MKKLWLQAGLMLFAASVAMSSASADEVMDKVHELQQAWAVANYSTDAKDKEPAFKALVARAEAVSSAYPQRAEPKVWEAIIRAGFAGAMGGLQSMTKAMPQMEKGRDLLLEAEKIDPKALNGSVYTTLGSFYYMTPGWPIGFGDDDKALEYLNKALQIAPNDMDANYFTGDYWLEEKEYKKARPYLEKVLALPDVEGRPVYSKGRKAEAKERLAKVEKKIRH
ncbi:MAG TPA: hypothetical protein VKA31_06325 [Mariprofundaceae bacterium]|nr:hypothetical protein [Mariprofundaceae bacterium]